MSACIATILVGSQMSFATGLVHQRPLGREMGGRMVLHDYLNMQVFTMDLREVFFTGTNVLTGFDILLSSEVCRMMGFHELAQDFYETDFQN